MASLRKRGRRWQVELYRNSQRESATFDTKAQAAAWALQREAELIGKRLPERTLADALKRYEHEVAPTHRGARWEIVRLRKFTQGFTGAATRPLQALTAVDIAQWRDARLRAVQAASVAREMNLLRSMFEAARRDWGWLHTNPMADVRRPGGHKARSRRVNDDEIWRLRCALGWPEDVPPQNASQRTAVAMMFAVETAMRSGEIVSLAWDQVHLQQRFVHLNRTKNGDDRDVPLSTRAAELLRLLPHEGPLVFGLDATLRDVLFRKARTRAELTDLHFHDLRHEATTRLARKLDVLDLSRMTGHRDLKSLRHYYNPTASEIAQRLA